MYLIKTEYMMVVLWVYLALTIGFLSAYIIYNRGFSRKGITPDMLPDSMTPIEKDEFIEDGKRRIEKSKWMLTVIFPLVMTFCIDLFMLFVVEPLFMNIGG